MESLLNFPRRFSITQVTLHGTRTLLMSEDAVLTAPANLCADGSSGKHFSGQRWSASITITLPSTREGALLRVPGAPRGSKLVSLIIKCLHKGLP